MFITAKKAREKTKFNLDIDLIKLKEIINNAIEKSADNGEFECYIKIDNCNQIKKKYFNKLLIDNGYKCDYISSCEGDILHVNWE